MDEWKSFTSPLWCALVTTLKRNVSKSFAKQTCALKLLSGTMVSRSASTVTFPARPLCENLPTMLHVLRLVHANGQLDSEVAVGTTLGHAHLVELGLLGTVGGWMQHDLQRNISVTLEELLRSLGQRRGRHTAALGLVLASSSPLIMMFLTFPSSLSSRANTPVFSVNSFTLTAGRGWVVVKSPWVPQLKARTRADEAAATHSRQQPATAQKLFKDH